ncbi:MAG TPA: CoA synthetase, partial [Casimicrobiaceae bacterium]|nr:CoA synthetase [Casimicrobiaceae bacterium]
LLLVPAIEPDVFIFHAALADTHGNVWIAGRRDLAYTAHAAKRTLVTAEEIYQGDLFADERLAAGTLGAVYVSAVAHVPRGAWPLTLQHRYLEDADHLQEYAELAKTRSGFDAYLRRYVLEEPAQGRSA